MVDERIAARRRQVREERRLGRLRRTRSIVIAALVLLALVAVERSPLVALDRIEITGTERLETAEVREASQLRLGTSTLRLRLSAVEERVERLPLVLEADASRRDPLSVRIAVTEREPVLVARGREAVLVDRDGAVIAESEGEAEHLPEVRLEGSPPEPGEAVGESPALANAHAAWHGLTGPLRARVRTYRAEGPESLELVLEQGTVVRLGRADRMAEKARALGAILEDVGEEAEVGVIDVRAPSAPVVRP